MTGSFLTILRTYPWETFATVVIPVLGGLVLALATGISAFKSLQARFDQDRDMTALKTSMQQTEDGVQKSYDGIKQIQHDLDDVKKTLDELKKRRDQYPNDQELEQAVQAYTTAIQVGVMSRPAAMNRYDPIQALMKELPPVQVLEKHRWQPLIIKTAPNTFHVVFATKMRIPPRLTFTGIPNGVTPEVTKLTNYSFNVRFTPDSIEIITFDFEADAEL